MLPTMIDKIPVAIYIPTFNRIVTLETAIRSALGQTHPKIGVYVSDNASGDGTQALCTEFQTKYTNFTYLRSPINEGAANVAKLLACSSEPWFVLLGDDDFLDVDFVAKTLRFALANDCVSVVGTTVNYVDGMERLREQPFFIGDDDPLLRLFCFHNTPNTNSLFYGLRRRREVVLTEGLPGTDWVDTQINVFYGKVAAIEGTCLHREMSKWLGPENVVETEMYQNYLSNCGYTKQMLKSYDNVYKIIEVLYRYYLVLWKRLPAAQAKPFIYLIFCLEWLKVTPEDPCCSPDLAVFMKEALVETRQQGSPLLARFKALSKYLFDWHKPLDDGLIFSSSDGIQPGSLALWRDLLSKAYRRLSGCDAASGLTAAYVAMAATVLRNSSPTPIPLGSIPHS